jgi:hypothetical protein
VATPGGAIDSLIVNANHSVMWVAPVSGEGVAKDEVEAYKWWLLAAGQGNVIISNTFSKTSARRQMLVTALVLCQDKSDNEFLWRHHL